MSKVQWVCSTALQLQPDGEPIISAQSQAILRQVLFKWQKRNKGLQFKLYGYITSSCKISTDEAMFAKPGDADWILMQLPCYCH